MKPFINTVLALGLIFCFTQSLRSQSCINAVYSYENDCFNGALNLTLSVTQASVSPPYTITSSPAGIAGVMSGTTIILTNIAFQTLYNLFVMGAGSCSVQLQVIATNPSSPGNISVNPTHVSCFGGNNGLAFASYNTGIAPFTWLWSTGSSSPSISGLSSGAYSVAITDSKGCTATKQFTITQPGEIASKASTTFVPCYEGTISSVLTTTGGVAPFSYTVNGVGITGNMATGLSAGVQTVVTKDNKSCLQTNTVLISQQLQQVISPTINQPSCPGKSDGSLSVSVSGGVAGYTYTWQPGSSNVTSLSVIPVGSYTLLVTDASACITKSVFVVAPANAIVAPQPQIKKENCSAADAAFTLNISGGYPPYTQVTLPVNATGTLASGLSTGSYTTIITDTHGCIDSLRFYIGNLSTVSLTALAGSPVNCYNSCTGSILLTTQNAVAPITYSATGTPSTSSSLISNLCAGLYIVSAVDAIGCPAFDTINFPTPPVFSYSAATPPAMCVGKQAILTGTSSGGSGTHTFIWNPGTIHGAAINVAPSATTVYSLNVYDSKGCTLAPYEVTVNVRPAISITINNSNAGICPGTTAQITPTVSGGDGNYIFSWLPGGSKSPTIFVENVTVPSYSLFVKDGCGSPTAVRVITIRLHPVIKPTFKTRGDSGCVPFCTTFINTTPQSKSAIWNYGDKPFEKAGDTTSYCYEKAGFFNLRLSLTDSNLCKTAFTYSNALEVLGSPKSNFLTDPGLVTLNNSENVLIKNISTNAESYKWFINNAYQGTKENIYYSFPDTGCYDIKLVALSSNRCIDSTIRSMCVFEGFNFYMPRAFTPNNDGLNDVLLPKGTGWLDIGYIFEVYNRWGHRIFKTSDVAKGWDGDLKADPYSPEGGIADPNDVYAWRAVVRDNMQNEHNMRGTVILVR